MRALDFVPISWGPSLVLYNADDDEKSFALIPIPALFFPRTGQKYYGGKSMHDVSGPGPNPYQARKTDTPCSQLVARPGVDKKPLNISILLTSLRHRGLELRTCIHQHQNPE